MPTDKRPKGKKIELRAGPLLEQLRRLGHTLDTAVADLIDNSIAAGAKNIEVVGNRKQKWLAVIDDGNGMTADILEEAMTPGSHGGFNSSRDISDLGRFGIGLKTASISLGDQLTVITRHKDDGLNTSRIDKNIIEKGD